MRLESAVRATAYRICRVRWPFAAVMLLALRTRAEPVRLPTVEVTEKALSQQTRADELRASEPGVADVIDVRQLAEGRSVADVLAETTGVQVQKLGGLGQFAQVSIRGSASDQVAVFVDGVPMQRASGGAVNLADLPLGQIERIEIFRGPPPTYLPGMPAGGAINIITRNPPERLVLEAAATGGSFVTRGLRGLARFGGERTTGLLSGEYRGSRGDFDFLDDNGTPLNRADDMTTARTNNGFDQSALHGRIDHRTQSGTQLRGDIDGFYAQRGLSGIGNIQTQRASLTTTRIMAILSAEKKSLLGSPRLTGALHGDVLWSEEHLSDRAAELVRPGSDVENATWSAGLRGHFHFTPLSRLMLGQIVAPRFERFTLDRYFPLRETLAPSRRISIDSSSTADIDLYDQRVWLTPQFRVLAVFDDFAGPVGFNVNAPLRVNGSQLHLAPSLGLRYSPSQGIWLRGSFYSGIRPPAFLELFGDRGPITGNPDLLPERIWGGEGGVSIAKNPTPTFELYTEATFYAKRASNLIQFVQNSQLTTRAINVGQADLWGGELRQSMAWHKTLGISMNYTYLSATDQSDIPFYRNRNLPRRPEHELSVEPYVRLLPGRRMRLASRITYVSSTFLDRANLKVTPARILLALEAAIDLPKGVRLEFVAENLLDERVQDFDGFPLPGRSFFATLSYRWASAAAPGPGVSPGVTEGVQ